MTTTETTESGLDAKALSVAYDAGERAFAIAYRDAPTGAGAAIAEEYGWQAAIKAAIPAYLAALPPNTVETQGDDVRPQVREVLAEISVADGWGMWRTCTGCHETNEGAETGHYPYSEAFGCYLGAGCHECGGIGAIWDPTDYDDMARHMLARSQPASVETQGEPVATLEIFDGRSTTYIENGAFKLPDGMHPLYAAPQPTPAGTLDPATVEACAKVAEEDHTPAYGPNDSATEWLVEKQRKDIASRIRSLTGGNGK